MEKDYLLMGTDVDAKVAIRFLSLQSGIKEIVSLQEPPRHVAKDYVRFVLASVLLGCRYGDQEATLYKFRYGSGEEGFNCEVSPKGPYRSTIMGGFEKKPKLTNGEFQVVRLKEMRDVYQSVVKSVGADIVDVFRSYLAKSDQNVSHLFVHSDIDNFSKNYALWIEKLSETTDKEWKDFTEAFRERSFFLDSFKESQDPDQIIQNLFPTKMRILSVTKPNRYCSCSRERILDALKVLPDEDLAEIFVQGQGVTTRCEYCHKEYMVTDEEVRQMMIEREIELELEDENKTLH